MRAAVRVWLGLGTAVLAAVAACGAAPASPVEARLQAVLPTPEEDRWLRPGWRTDLAQALREARGARKPVLFWVMNGNPLGCA